MSSINNIIHFFEMEIENCKQRKQIVSPHFNGYLVGLHTADVLNKTHIRYCQNIIDRIRSNSL